MQDESADQIFEEFQDIVQQAILREFPNRERKGCAGPEMLRALAERPRPTRDAAWEHVTHCSPCYREFLDLRGRVKEVRRLRRRRALRLRIAVVATAVVLVAVAIATYQVLRPGQGATAQGAGAYQSASLDLKDRSVARSLQGQPPKTQPLILPAKRLDLAIFLPIGSEPGRYEVQLLKKIEEPLLNVAGEAQVEHGTTILPTKIDLTQQASGSFLICFPPPPSPFAYCPVSLP